MGTIEKAVPDMYYCDICSNKKAGIIFDNNELKEDFKIMFICKSCLKEALEELEK